MGGGHPAPRMRPVELVDDADVADAGPWSWTGPARLDDEPRDDLATGRRLPARWWPWVVGLLGVALAAGGVATGAAERAARDRADAFAALPGVVRPLDRPPQVRWTVDVDGPTPVLGAAGAVVTVAETDGAWRVRASDPATGDARWEVTVAGSAGAGQEYLAVACTAAEGSTLLLCTWAEPDAVYGEGGTPATRVEALDARDGARRGSWRVDGPVVDLLRDGDDLLVAGAEPDRRVTVERRAGTDGDVRWSWTTAMPVIDTGGVRGRPHLEAGGGVVTLMGHWSTLLDGATGRVLRTVAGGGVVLVRGLADGGYATWEPAEGGMLRDADGTVRAQVTALPVDVVGDGSVPELLVDSGSRLHAVHAADGTVVWTAPVDATPLAVADGVVVVAQDRTVGAVDGRDGEVLWEHRLDEELLPRPLTDGWHVLVPETDPGGASLVARGLRDGVEVWRVPLPRDVREVRAVAGRIVVRTPGDALVLG